MKKILLWITGIVLMGCSKSGPEPLNIAVASNSRTAVEEIAMAFTDSTGIPCNIISASSGKLSAQIMEGAPFDLFLSADMDYPQDLWDQGYGQEEPWIYTRGVLVIWSMDSTLLHLDSLSSSSIEKIALANPRNAPYGKAAMEAMGSAGETLNSKLVYGENVSQASQFLISDAAELVFTSKSVALNGEGYWKTVNMDSYAALDQGVLRISESESGRRFYEFLKSEGSLEILTKYGYEQP